MSFQSKQNFANKYSKYHNGYNNSYFSSFLRGWSYQQKTMFYLFGGIFLLFLFCYIVKNIFSDHLKQPAVLNHFFEKPAKPSKVKGESKGETLCREAAEKIFKKNFVKVRPDFLKNNVTGMNLELDIYNEELKLAIEFNGQQHYKYVPFFHKNYEHFLNQKYRDEIKKMLCKQNNIHLIEISYELAPTDIETTIKLEAIKLGFKLEAM